MASLLEKLVQPITWRQIPSGSGSGIEKVSLPLQSRRRVGA